mgnify:CR=1 FL=1
MKKLIILFCILFLVSTLSTVHAAESERNMTIIDNNTNQGEFRVGIFLNNTDTTKIDIHSEDLTTVTSLEGKRGAPISVDYENNNYTTVSLVNNSTSVYLIKVEVEETKGGMVEVDLRKGDGTIDEKKTYNISEPEYDESNNTNETYKGETNNNKPGPIDKVFLFFLELIDKFAEFIVDGLT